MRILELAKLIGGPGSLGFLCLAVLILLVFGWLPKTRRASRLGIVLVLGGYLVLALPVVAHAITDRLTPTHGVGTSVPREIQTLFIFDGDNREGRVRLVRQLIRRHRPVSIWLLGAGYMLDDLHRAGLGPEQVMYDPSAHNTMAQVDRVQNLLEQQRTGPGQAAVVTSRVQAPRVRALLAIRHLDVHVLEGRLDREPPRDGLWSVVPSHAALLTSRDSIYEHLALAYYRRRGVIE